MPWRGAGGQMYDGPVAPAKEDLVGLAIQDQAGVVEVAALFAAIH